MAATAKQNRIASAVPIEFRDYQTLHAALRRAREMRNISFELWDEIAGVSRGYTSKVLSPEGSRKITMQSLGWLLAGLGLKAILVDDPDTLKTILPRFRPRDLRLVRNSPRRKSG